MILEIALRNSTEYSRNVIVLGLSNVNISLIGKEEPSHIVTVVLARVYRGYSQYRRLTLVLISSYSQYPQNAPFAWDTDLTCLHVESCGNAMHRLMALKLVQTPIHCSSEQT